MTGFPSLRKSVLSVWPLTLYKYDSFQQGSVMTASHLAGRRKPRTHGRNLLEIGPPILLTHRSHTGSHVTSR